MGPFFEPKTKKWGFFFNIKRFINKSSLKLCLICTYTLFAGFFCHRSWRDVDQHYILVPLITNTNIVLHLIESFLKRKKKSSFWYQSPFCKFCKVQKGFHNWIGWNSYNQVLLYFKYTSRVYTRTTDTQWRHKSKKFGNMCQ